MPGPQFSGFLIDLPTLYLVTFFVAVTAGLLLLFSWAQNRSIPALALWGLGYLLGAAAAAFVAARGLMPDGWGLLGAYTLACCAYGVFWAGARSFEGRKVHVPLAFAGAAIFIICSRSGVRAMPVSGYFVLVNLINAAYTLSAARELWNARERELMSRWPTLVLMVVHASFLLARLPFAGDFPPVNDGAHHTAVVVMSFEVLFVTFGLAFLRIAMTKERAELEQRRAALTDSLTGVPNRRAFFAAGDRLLEPVSARRCSAALVLFDLDRFKEVNDTAGHEGGDRVLIAFCRLVASAIRPDDILGRLGGEEFACLLHNVSMAEALQTSEQIRRDFAAMRFSGLDVGVTVSVGVAMASETDRTLQSLLATADRALYRAKAEGRNRVAPAPPMLIEAASRRANRVERESVA